MVGDRREGALFDFLAARVNLLRTVEVPQVARAEENPLGFPAGACS